MALAVGDANSKGEFVFPTSEEMGHPAMSLEHPLGGEWSAGRFSIQVE